MAFEYLSNVPLDEAVEGFLGALAERGFAPRVERVPVGEALGRVTAEPLYAAISAPPITTRAPWTASRSRPA